MSGEFAETDLEISGLHKLATVQAKNKDYDAAIISLLHSYELMRTHSISYGIKTYFRVARYHHLAGRFHELLQWLSYLYASVDARANEREVLYEQWGWMQSRNSFLKVSTESRDIERSLIKEEIDLFKKRQKTIEARELKNGKKSK